jgi:hypothetical protein
MLDIRTHCCILPPRPEDMVGFSHVEGQELGCIRRDAHHGAHVFRRSDGKLILWENDYTCDCCPEPDDSDHCIEFGEITEEEFQALEAASK